MSCSTAWCARRTTPSAGSLPSGWSITSSGSPETRRAESWLTASPWNAVVAMSPAGVPSLATSNASWRLHDVQDPQSPEPAKTTSQALASSAMISGAAGLDTVALRRWTIALAP